MGKNKRKFGKCAYCGNEGQHTVDHIPPKGIYSSRERGNLQMHTVLACHGCHDDTKQDDEQFKIHMMFETGEHREHADDVIDAMAATLASTKTLGRQLLNSSRMVETPDGPMIAADFDLGAYERVVIRIVRALYYREKGTNYPGNAQIQVHAQGEISQNSFEKAQPKGLNGNTFAYRVIWTPEGTSCWQLSFFGRHQVQATASAP